MCESGKGRDVKEYLNDIKEMIESIQSFTQGMSFEDFENDRKTLFAVIRCFEVIGEAVKYLPVQLKEKYPDIPWIAVTGMRNKLIHHYFGIDVQMMWDTIHEDMTDLQQAVSLMINEIS